MEYNEDDYLLLSGLQHFAFCRRQWALIHIENLWAENLRTTEGELLHERAHDASVRERRGNVITVRGVSSCPSAVPMFFARCTRSTWSIRVDAANSLVLLRALETVWYWEFWIISVVDLAKAVILEGTVQASSARSTTDSVVSCP